MQYSSRIHIKVKSPDVWKKLADIDLNKYFMLGRGKDVFPKDSTSFIINGDWGCTEEELTSLVKKISKILKKECIIVADCTCLNVDPYSFIVYYFGNHVETCSYSILDRSYYSREVRKEKGKLWKLYFNANINDITKYISYNLFFPNKIDRIEGEQLRDFGINIEKNYIFEKELLHYCGNKNVISIPGEAEIIKSFTFLYCDTIEKVHMPEGIIRIDKDAFGWCSSLKEINIPDSVTEIKEAAFEYCKALEEIKIPKNVSRIEECTFWHCKSLKKIEFADNIIEIGANAFAHCESLQEIKLPKNVTKIRKGVFNGCKSLKKIELPEGIIEIGSNAFSNCQALQEIIIPKGVIKIGKDAFSGCKSLERIELPDGIIEIKKKAFANCISLREVNLPESLTKIGEDAFIGCKYLK